MFDWIAFDADDTLWKNEEYYREGREKFAAILEKYDLQLSQPDQIDQVESHNIQYYGYGVMSFILSLIEMGIKLTGGSLETDHILELLEYGKQMLSAEVVLLPGAEQLLSNLSKDASLMLITKGDLFHQLRKVESSGLRSYFQVVEVVSEKDPSIYRGILEKYTVNPNQFVMIGNSLRSDIKPVLEIGGRAVHLTDHLSWSHEDDVLEHDYRDRFRAVAGLSDVGPALEELARKADY